MTDVASQPNQEDPKAGYDDAAAAIAAGSVVAGAAPPVAGAVIGALTAKAIVATAKRVIDKLLSWSKFRWNRLWDPSGPMYEQVVKEYPDEDPKDVMAILDAREREFEHEFRRKMKKRLARDIPDALHIVDPKRRAARLKAIFSRETRYTAMREEAMLSRSMGALEAEMLQKLSPQGAYWKLSQHVKEHTVDCLAMGEQFWPWSVLRKVQPPLHYGCPCYLLGLDEAIEEDLMTDKQVPDEEDAKRRYGLLADKIEDLRDLNEEEVAELYEAAYVNLSTDLEEAAAVRKSLRWAKGLVKGGQFRPTRGGSAGSRVRGLALPESPTKQRGAKRGRWTWIAGRYTKVPVADNWTRKVGEKVYQSPPGGTNVYLNGELINKPGQASAGTERVKASTGTGTRSMSAATAAEIDAAVAKFRNPTRTSGTVPPVAVGDSPSAVMALEDAGYALIDAQKRGNGIMHLTYRNSQGVLDLDFGEADSVVKTVDWTPAIAYGDRIGLRRPAASWNEHRADSLAYADDLGAKYGAEVKAPSYDVDAALSDHAGTHKWSGEVYVGADTPQDIERAAATRAGGNLLSEDEKRGVYASYWVTGHELSHAVNPINPSSFVGANAALEEALAEEMGHKLALDRLAHHGQYEVIDWRAKNPDALAVRGVYRNERLALKTIFDEADVPEADRSSVIEAMCFRMNPDARLSYLATLHAANTGGDVNASRARVEALLASPPQAPRDFDSIIHSFSQYGNWDRNGEWQANQSLGAAVAYVEGIEGAGVLGDGVPVVRYEDDSYGVGKPHGSSSDSLTITPTATDAARLALMRSDVAWHYEPAQKATPEGEVSPARKASDRALAVHLAGAPQSPGTTPDPSFEYAVKVKRKMDKKKSNNDFYEYGHVNAKDAKSIGTLIEKARVSVRVTPAGLSSFLKTGVMLTSMDRGQRPSWRVKDSGYSAQDDHYLELRRVMEEALFGASSPVYGYFRDKSGTTQDGETEFYGGVIVELNPQVKDRTTWSIGDSLNTSEAYATVAKGKNEGMYVPGRGGIVPSPVGESSPLAVAILGPWIPEDFSTLASIDDLFAARDPHPLVPSKVVKRGRGLPEQSTPIPDYTEAQIHGSRPTTDEVARVIFQIPSGTRGNVEKEFGPNASQAKALDKAGIPWELQRWGGKVVKRGKTDYVAPDQTAWERTNETSWGGTQPPAVAPKVGGKVEKDQIEGAPIGSRIGFVGEDGKPLEVERRHYGWFLAENPDDFTFSTATKGVEYAGTRSYYGGRPPPTALMTRADIENAVNGWSAKVGKRFVETERYGNPVLDTELVYADTDKGAKWIALPPPPSPQSPGTMEVIGGKEDTPVDNGTPYPNYNGTRLTVAGSAGGSNGARWGTDEKGNRWLIKSYDGDENRVATELVANRVYDLLGAKVAEAGVIEMNGRTALTYEALDGEPRFHVFDNGGSEALGQHFMADALVANWDFVGLEDDNILWGSDEQPIRVDQGGALEFRAMGGSKPFGDVPTEVWTMLDEGQARRASIVSDEQKREQAANIEAVLTPAVVDALMDGAPFEDQQMRERVRGSLKARVAWMGRFSRGEEDVPEPPASPGTATEGRVAMPVTDPEATIAKVRASLEAAGVKVGDPQDEVVVKKPITTTITDVGSGSKKTVEDELKITVPSQLTPATQAMFLAGVNDSLNRYPQVSDVLREVTFVTSASLGSEEGEVVPDTKPDGSDWAGWRGDAARNTQRLRSYAWNRIPGAFYSSWHEEANGSRDEVDDFGLPVGGKRRAGKIVLNDLIITRGKDAETWVNEPGITGGVGVLPIYQPARNTPKNAYGIAVHEFGHAIVNHAQRRDGSNPFFVTTDTPKLSDTLDTRGWDYWKTYGFTPEEISAVSNYATVSPEEAFAEMFTAYEGGVLDAGTASKFEGLLADLLGDKLPDPPSSPGTAKRSGMRATPAAIAKIKQELVDLEVEVGEPERRKSGESWGIMDRPNPGEDWQIPTSRNSSLKPQQEARFLGGVLDSLRRYPEVKLSEVTFASSATLGKNGWLTENQVRNEIIGSLDAGALACYAQQIGKLVFNDLTSPRDRAPQKDGIGGDVVSNLPYGVAVHEFGHALAGDSIQFAQAKDNYDPSVDGREWNELETWEKDVRSDPAFYADYEPVYPFARDSYIRDVPSRPDDEYYEFGMFSEKGAKAVADAMNALINSKRGTGVTWDEMNTTLDGLRDDYEESSDTQVRDDVQAVLEKNNLWEDSPKPDQGWWLFEQHQITPEEIAGISNYATTTPDEAFAEMFAAYELGFLDGTLSKRFEGLLEEVRASGNTPDPPASPGTDPKPNLTNTLEQFAKFMAQSRDKPAGWKYGGLEEFVLAEGRSWEPQPLPENVAKWRGKPKECYKNAADAVIGMDGKQPLPDSRYVEGYVHVAGIEGLPIAHAWAVDKDGKVLELTMDEPGVEYVGVEVPTDVLTATLLRREMYGVFEDYQGGFPFLQHGMTPPPESPGTAPFTLDRGTFDERQNSTDELHQPKPFPGELPGPLKAATNSDELAPLWWDDAESATAENFDLNTVTPAQIKKWRKAVYDHTQESLRFRGLPEEFVAYRYGDLRPMPTNFSLYPGTVYRPRYGGDSLKGDYDMKQEPFLVRREDVVIDTNAFFPSAFVGEHEIVLRDGTSAQPLPPQSPGTMAPVATDLQVENVDGALTHLQRIGFSRQARNPDGSRSDTVLAATKEKRDKQEARIGTSLDEGSALEEDGGTQTMFLVQDGKRVAYIQYFVASPDAPTPAVADVGIPFQFLGSRDARLAVWKRAHPDKTVVLIDRLEVRGDLQRQGLATSLMARLHEKYPDTPVDHGNRTADGEAWAASALQDARVTMNGDWFPEPYAPPDPRGSWRDKPGSADVTMGGEPLPPASPGTESDVVKTVTLDDKELRVAYGEVSGLQTTTRVFAAFIETRGPAALLTVDADTNTVELAFAYKEDRGLGLASSLLKVARLETGSDLAADSGARSPMGKKWADAQGLKAKGDIPFTQGDADKAGSRIMSQITSGYLAQDLDVRDVTPSEPASPGTGMSPVTPPPALTTAEKQAIIDLPSGDKIELLEDHALEGLENYTVGGCEVLALALKIVRPDFKIAMLNGGWHVVAYDPETRIAYDASGARNLDDVFVPYAGDIKEVTEPVREGFRSEELIEVGVRYDVDPADVANGDYGLSINGGESLFDDRDAGREPWNPELPFEGETGQAIWEAGEAAYKTGLAGLKWSEYWHVPFDPTVTSDDPNFVPPPPASPGTDPEFIDALQVTIENGFLSSENGYVDHLETPAGDIYVGDEVTYSLKGWVGDKKYPEDEPEPRQATAVVRGLEKVESVDDLVGFGTFRDEWDKEIDTDLIVAVSPNKNERAEAEKDKEAGVSRGASKTKEFRDFPQTLVARHPDFGVVGAMSYVRDTYTDDSDKRREGEIRVLYLHVPEEHRRKWVASTLNEVLAKEFPTVPVDHGSRTTEGDKWAAGASVSWLTVGGNSVEAPASGVTDGAVWNLDQYQNLTWNWEPTPAERLVARTPDPPASPGTETPVAPPQSVTNPLTDSDGVIVRRLYAGIGERRLRVLEANGITVSLPAEETDVSSLGLRDELFDEPVKTISTPKQDQRLYDEFVGAVADSLERYPQVADALGAVTFTSRNDIITKEEKALSVPAGVEYLSHRHLRHFLTGQGGGIVYGAFMAASHVQTILRNNDPLRDDYDPEAKMKVKGKIFLNDLAIFSDAGGDDYYERGKEAKYTIQSVAPGLYWSAVATHEFGHALAHTLTTSFVREDLDFEANRGKTLASQLNWEYRDVLGTYAEAARVLGTTQKARIKDLPDESEVIVPRKAKDGGDVAGIVKQGRVYEVVEMGEDLGFTGTKQVTLVSHPHLKTVDGALVVTNVFGDVVAKAGGWGLFRNHDITPQEIAAVSKYATTKPEEAFCELFTAYELGVLDESVRPKFESLLEEFGVTPPPPRTNLPDSPASPGTDPEFLRGLNFTVENGRLNPWNLGGSSGVSMSMETAAGEMSPGDTVYWEVGDPKTTKDHKRSGVVVSTDPSSQQDKGGIFTVEDSNGGEWTGYGGDVTKVVPGDEDVSTKTIVARHPDYVEPVGSLSYIERADYVEVEMLYVPEEHRRKWVASTLNAELNKLFPDTPIDHGYRTDDGEAWSVGAGLGGGEDEWTLGGKPIPSVLPPRLASPGTTDPSLRVEEVDAATFHKAFQPALNSKRGAYLSPYTEEEFAKMTLFLSADGMYGGAVKTADDGVKEAVSLFNVGGAKTSGGGIVALEQAVAAGATRLDCLGKGLKKKYEKVGFVVTETINWDDKYAPDGWDYEKEGRPSIYIMELVK